MNRIGKLNWIASAALVVMRLAQPSAAQDSAGGFVPPEGWAPPPLDPAGVQLETRELGAGVYALLSNRPPVDNSGFVVGERGVLMIDAHFNGAMARQIQAAVRKVTDKPILYLVNTNYHGDHTFGNYAFPAETKIVAHRKTAAACCMTASAWRISSSFSSPSRSRSRWKVGVEPLTRPARKFTSRAVPVRPPRARARTSRRKVFLGVGRLPEAITC